LKRFLAPNLTRAGRIVRAAGALALLIGGVIALPFSVWLAILLLISGGFVLFEALRGWCLLRACGIKTRL
jgi:hypothetical protein